MTEKEFRLTVQMMMTLIEKKKYILQDVLIKEYKERRNLIDIENMINVLLKDFSNIETNINLDRRRVAVICDGSPNITLQILLASLKNNMKIRFVVLNHYDINNFLYDIFSNVMQELAIPNTYFTYSENFLEQDIIEKSKNFDKIIYIGNYFDYENFEYFCENKNVLFWNNNNIKVLMSREKYKVEYKDIIKFSYSSNVEIEVYEDENEFLEEVQEGEFALIYTDEENKEKFLSSLKARIVKFNKFDIQDFKFNVNDLILALDFSKEM